MRFRWVIGLGNPGFRYEHTRHNAGFLFADELAKKLELTFEQKTRFPADLAMDRGRRVAICKPLGFMNLSGHAARSTMEYFDEESTHLTYIEDELMIAYDDLDLPLGSIKVQKGKFPKVHNGVNDCVASFGTGNFTHIRIGTETRTSKVIPGEQFVLMQMTAEEENLLRDSIQNVIPSIYARIISS